MPSTTRTARAATTPVAPATADPIRRAGFWLGALILAAAITFAGPPGQGGDERRLVSKLLFGQDDPDSLRAAGLHGLGGRIVPIAFERLSRCRYRIADANRSEIIDFDRVEEIRHEAMNDPAAGVARAIDRSEASREQPRALAVAILTGIPSAFCDAGDCTDRRVFALSDPARLDDARAAAANFRRQFCPGPR